MRASVQSLAFISALRPQIERCKGLIRECLRECDEPEGYKQRIPDEAYDEEGEVEAEFILCTLCSHLESYDVSAVQGLLRRGKPAELCSVRCADDAALWWW